MDNSNTPKLLKSLIIQIKKESISLIKTDLKVIGIYLKNSLLYN